jgi:hypothetical protein
VSDVELTVAAGVARMSESPRDAMLRWKLERDIEVYRFYLDVSVKASIFLMAVTGGISSYVLSKSDSPIISVALAFPAIINAGFAVFFFYSIREARRIAQVHTDVCRTLGVPEFNLKPLRSVCQIFCLMSAVATAGLLLLMAASLSGKVRGGDCEKTRPALASRKVEMITTSCTDLRVL